MRGSFPVFFLFSSVELEGEGVLKQRSRLFTPLTALLVSAVLLILDQIVKYFVVKNLKPVGSVSLIPGLLEFSYVENTGVAFGLLKNQTWLVATITLLASVAVLVLLFRYNGHTFFSCASLSLILAGGVGNLLDRLIYGYVVDFIHVMFFGYVFNIADCCITVGAVLFAIHCLFFVGKKNKGAADSAGFPEDSR